MLSLIGKFILAASNHSLALLNHSDMACVPLQANMEIVPRSQFSNSELRSFNIFRYLLKNGHF